MHTRALKPLVRFVMQKVAAHWEIFVGLKMRGC